MAATFGFLGGAYATAGFVGVAFFNVDTYGLVTHFFGKFSFGTELTDGVENIGELVVGVRTIFVGCTVFGTLYSKSFFSLP